MVPRRRGLSYKDSGVDVGAADRLVAKIAKLALRTQRPGVLSGIGPFAAAVRMPRGFTDPVLLASADGVGTKLEIARLADRHSTIGIDLVAMNVNDLVTAGARPLFFLDYLATGKLSAIDAEAVVGGIVEGCRMAAMSLVGGETAELPGAYPDGEYDLAGFCVGVAERRRIVDGRRVRAGDLIVGLESNGLHSNGFSLARRALDIKGGASLRRRAPGHTGSLADELLRPTRIYARPVLAALERFSIKAMAHITGGGLAGNLKRVLPPGTGALVHRQAMPKMAIFDAIADRGGVARREMDRTFNCGIGYVAVVGSRQAQDLCTFFRRRRFPARIIGEIKPGKRTVRYQGKA